MKRHKERTFLRVGALLAVAVTWASLAQAKCSITWTGNVDYWNNPNNWKPRRVPGPTDNVCIPSGEADGRTTPSISVHSIQVSNSAVLVFGSGTVSVATSVTIQQAYLSLLGTTLSATSVVNQSGTLMGNGTIEGSLTNDGFLEPNAQSLTVTGNYTQASTGELSEYWGSAATLNVNLNATLSGYLVVHYSTKIPPMPGSTYTAMTFGSLSGAFTNVSPGTAEYTNNSVVVTFP
ncbi:MAG TPA: hypothetical protein VMQ17_15095 [Candidatus Sulfotelmatobacter sp.]|jgi:hypothetical protein|nr:hypothetical protein [Candidatus Sulfotelmatobacter sp.]